MNRDVLTLSFNEGYDDENRAVSMTLTDAVLWTQQVDLFYHFLIAQGFLLSERELAEYFSEKADEIGDLRSNGNDVVDDNPKTMYSKEFADLTLDEFHDILDEAYLSGKITMVVYPEHMVVPLDNHGPAFSRDMRNMTVNEVIKYLDDNYHFIKLYQKEGSVLRFYWEKHAQ